MYLDAKKHKKELEDIIDSTIYNFYKVDSKKEFMNYLSKKKPENQKEILRQLNIWKINLLNYAKKRYPNA